MNQAKEKISDSKSYLLGAALCLVLTLIPFYLIWSDYKGAVVFYVISVLAVVQVIVQLKFFLHLSFRGRKKEDLQLVMFTCLILAIMVFGTLWVMYDLNTMQ